MSHGTVSQSKSDLDKKADQKKNLLERVSKMALAAVLVPVLTAFAVAYYTSYLSNAPASVELMLPVQADKDDLFRGETVMLALVVRNRSTGVAMEANGYECRLGGLPKGAKSQPIDGKTCSFYVKNAGVENDRDDKNEWPVTSEIILTASEPSGQKTSPPATIRFHDIERPFLDRGSFQWRQNSLHVQPHINSYRETASKVALCEWSPADLFVRSTISEDACTATFRRIPQEPLPDISVVVTFKDESGRPFSAPATENTAVVVPPRPETPDSNAGAKPVLTSDAASPLRAAVPATSSPPPNATKTPTTATAEPGDAPAALIAQLRNTLVEERYERLLAGLRAFPVGQRISAAQATLLLGTLAGNARSSAIQLLLPFLQAPIASQDAIALLQGVTSSDRADTVHALAGCITRPADKTGLLAGIYGSDRPWVETALDSVSPCSLTPHAG